MEQTVLNGKWVVVTTLLLLVVAGCKLLGGGDSAQLDELESHRTVWQRNNPGTYSYTLFRGCFCVHAGSFRVRVENNVVTEVRTIGPEETPVDPKDFGMDLTIDGIFDYIRDAYNRDADSVEIDWSGAGYPNRITIDFYRQAVDDEMVLQITDVFTILEGDSS